MRTVSRRMGLWQGDALLDCALCNQCHDCGFEGENGLDRTLAETALFFTTQCCLTSKFRIEA